MVALRERPSPSGMRTLAPQGNYIGEPRFRWQPHGDAWLYRVDLVDASGETLARGWSGFQEVPLAWLRTTDGRVPELTPGEHYRWRVHAYKDGPDGEPCDSAPWTEFLFLGP